MSKIKALITMLVLGTSASAMADTTFQASARASFQLDSARVSQPALVARDLRATAPAPVMVRDHRIIPHPRPDLSYVRFDDFDSHHDGRDGRHDRFIAATITGTYQSNYGVVRLTQQGNRVRGTYETGGGGIIKGRIVDGVLYYRWKQADSEGHGVWFLNGRGRINSISGTWGTNASESDGGAWNLQRLR